MQNEVACVMVDKRLKRFVEILIEWGISCYSVKLTDIDDTFWFDDKNKVQEFLLVQQRERFYAKELREGFFEYINENSEKLIYKIINVKRGKLVVKEN